mgnify:CR=1 FL=1
MNFELLKLSDGTFPKGSPLRDVVVSVETTAAYELPEYYPDYVWVDDPEWTYTDSRGHEHYREGDEFPTLRENTEWISGYCCEDCGGDFEDFESVFYECLGCGERIRHVGEKRERYVPQIPSLIEITLNRVTRYNTPLDLRGIEPVSAHGDGEYWELTYRPTWDEWLRLVEMHNRVVREVAG